VIGGALDPARAMVVVARFRRQRGTPERKTSVRYAIEAATPGGGTAPGSVAVNGGIMTVVPDRNRSKEQKDPLEAHRRVRKRVPPPGRVLPDRREKLRERAERTERDADREQDPGRG